eukprot:TRINITY_DN74084_c0_g1_i1.p1 TRINITY_DN74084_c0_g1~~TRINITY_DN74084_c0_g1_i1.p1  ORF type:complete len:273 (-),score=78.45 TRINITY_DN74084_c0_g1_i1:123-824(-)
MVDVNVQLARVAERAERYDEMAEFMAARAQTGVPLNEEERDMFSAAFKNSLSERRQAVRITVGVIYQQEGVDPKLAELASGYRTKVEAELATVCEKALKILREILVPQTQQDDESKTFYLKMQGDYNRYLAEFASGTTKENATQAALQAYHDGLTLAKASLKTTHPVNLGLALNYSIFQHEVLADTNNAVATATNALNAAAADLDNVPPEMRADALLTMQLLQDNLELWAPAQ